MIGSVMAVPVRETVVGFVLLAYGINGKGECSEVCDDAAEDRWWE
jgi:hypothetical protein